MRVGILSYPMLFQREGGLQVQVRETLAALARLGPESGIEAELVDPCHSRLSDYDVVHVFAAINGNHRIVETATELGVPVLLSPLIPPGWNRSSGTLARVGDRLLGNLTSWNVQTSYAQIRGALELATRIAALGEAEREAIHSAFLIDPAKVQIVPNGISPHFFSADPRFFRSRSKITGPFVLMVGAISPYKNQLGMAEALAGHGLPFVLIGEAQERDTDYLRQVRAVSGVTWIGPLRHGGRMLASAYAAASVFALPSQGEVFPLTVLESLAAGTPVVMTSESALDLPDSGFALKKVQWDDGAALQRAVAGLAAAAPERERVRALVRGFTWEGVAAQLARSYVELVDGARLARSGVAA